MWGKAREDRREKDCVVIVVDSTKSFDHKVPLLQNKAQGPSTSKQSTRETKFAVAVSFMNSNWHKKKKGGKKKRVLGIKKKHPQNVS